MPKRPHRSKSKPTVDPKMVRAVKHFAALVTDAVQRVGLMQTGLLPREGARALFHQIEEAIRQCQAHAHQADWADAREHFLLYGEMLVEERDNVREMVI